jgi:hypothetical protein
VHKQIEESDMDENDKRFIESLFERQTEQFQRYIGIVSEGFDHKLGIFAEGHQFLAEKLDRIETRIDLVESNLVRKIDTIAADISVHRADTEAHHGLYLVKEG